MCQIINKSTFIATQKFYLCQVSDCLSFPQILHAKGCSFWTSHTQNTTLGWFKKLFQPLKSFCRSDKAKHKLVVTKISRIGKSSNIACVASVSNRVTARKLEREQKKNFLFLLSSQLSRRTREETLATQATSNTVSFLFRVSGRWVHPWFHTVIGPLHDELILLPLLLLLLLLLLLPESLRDLLSWTNEGFTFQTSHNLRSGPQNKKARRTTWLQVKLFAEIN